jgi:hypothetical protein
MSADSGGINCIDFSNLRLGPFDIGAKQGNYLSDLEVAMDQMDAKDLVSVVADKQSSEVLDMLVWYERLISIIAEPVISMNMLDIIIITVK